MPREPALLDPEQLPATKTPPEKKFPFSVTIMIEAESSKALNAAVKKASATAAAQCDDLEHTREVLSSLGEDPSKATILGRREALEDARYTVRTVVSA